jgi:acetyl-CoA synthetase
VTTQSTSGVEALASESRRFEPPVELAASANVTAEAYDRAAQDRLAFWEEQAGRLQWDTPWDTVVDWQPPFAKWFVGGKLNVAVNCVDRHVEAGNGDRIALHWVGEPEGDTRDISYSQLQVLVSQAANGLEALGVTAGDRVCIYLPMIPEAVISMLACARIGAAHSVVFGGFSAQALSTASPTPRPRSSSPPTAATAAAPRAPSSPPSTRPSSAARRSPT